MRRYTHTRAFEPNLTLGDVAAALDADLHIPAQSLAFVFKGRQLPHASRLADHGLVLGGAVNAITMSVQVGAQKPTGSGVAGSSGGTQARDSTFVSDYVMPDVITVEVDVGKDQPPRVIHVCAPQRHPDWAGWLCLALVPCADRFCNHACSWRRSSSHARASSVHGWLAASPQTGLPLPVLSSLPPPRV